MNYKKTLFIGLFSLLLPIFTFAFTVPEKPKTFVNDFAGVLSTEQISALESKLSAYEKQSTNEIAVVIIKSLDGDVIENVAQDIFTKWGIGKKDKNNGVLFLIAVDERKTRIHTGYGVEGDLTDIGTSYIQSDVVTPAFRADDYAGGINGAVDKMIEALGGMQIVPENYSTQTSGPRINFEFIFIVGFIVLQFLGAILGKSKSWWAGGVIGGIVGIILWFFKIFALTLVFYIVILILLIVFGLLFDYIVSKAHDQKKNTGAFPAWFLFLGGGGRGGGSGGGGGFGGFGGGSSGGGGSNGSW